MEELLEDPVFSQFMSTKEINRGGCGIYALAVARYLMNRGFDKLELIACCRDYEPDIRENIHNNNHIINNVPAHIVLKAGEYCFDAEGIIEHDVFMDKMEADGKDCLTIDFNDDYLVKAINNVWDWNPSFNRHEWVPTIARNFNIQLNDIAV